MSKVEMRYSLPIGFALLLWCSFPLNADVIFSNLTGVYTAYYFGLSCTDVVFGCTGRPGAGAYTESAEAFTPNQSYSLTDVQLAIFDPQTYPAEQYSVYLFTDANGTPGTPIAVIGGGTANNSVETVTALNGGIPLNSGTQYWVVVESNTLVLWAGGGGAAAVPYAILSYSGNSFPPPPPPTWTPSVRTLQFEVDGVPIPANVPEPPTFPVTAITIAVCLGARIRLGKIQAGSSDVPGEVAPCQDYNHCT